MAIIRVNLTRSGEQEERPEGKRAVQGGQRDLAWAVRELETMVPPPIPTQKDSALYPLGSHGSALVTIMLRVPGSS